MFSCMLATNDSDKVVITFTPHICSCSKQLSAERCYSAYFIDDNLILSNLNILSILSNLRFGNKQTFHDSWIEFYLRFFRLIQST